MSPERTHRSSPRSHHPIAATRAGMRSHRQIVTPSPTTAAARVAHHVQKASPAQTHGEQPPPQHDREPLDPDVPCRDGTPCATGRVEELVVHGDDCMSTHCVLSSIGNAGVVGQRTISRNDHFAGVGDHDASIIHATTMELLVVCPGRLVRRAARCPRSS